MGEKKESKSPGEKSRPRRRHSRSNSRERSSRRRERHNRSHKREDKDDSSHGHRSRKDRDRSRTPARSRRHKSAFSGPGEGGREGAQSVQQLQQQQLQRQLLAQQLMLQQNAMTGTNALIANKKQREVYVGNLTIGIVTADMLRELFNGALSSLVPDPVTNPPVVSVNMDASGRFGFVEMRSEELANAAMQMDKVELCGRHVNIGRPRGYIEPPAGMASTRLGLPGPLGSASSSLDAPRTVLLENLLTAEDLRLPNAVIELMDEVKAECEKWSTVVGITCPSPPDSVEGPAASRVYVKMSSVEEAKKTKEFMDGRSFDNNTVACRIVPDDEFDRAERGEWI